MPHCLLSVFFDGTDGLIENKDSLTSLLFDQTIADANEFYAAAATAAAQPWTQARPQLQALESTMSSDDANPLVRVLTPAFSRAVQIQQRSESQRQAITLVANIMAYKQRTGDYPTNLDVFGQKPYLVDPLSNQPFVYKRTSDGGFQLYSIGENGIDDGGQHSPKWDESPDRVYWPRPPKK